LPDLQREAGVALGDTSAWPVEVREGIAAHHAADAAFHDLALFRTQSLALTQVLRDREVPRGAARAIGHAGWELLFDGALLERAGTADAYVAAMAVDVSAFAPEWDAALARRVAHGPPWFYAEPASVAELLRRVLAHRELLAFDRSHCDVVAACLADAQPAIVDAVDEVLAALT
jgi:hypothetical protein